MNVRTVLRGISLVAATLLLAAPKPATAIAIWPSMPGLWAGFGQSSMLPAVQGQADLEITAQRRGVFHAVTLLPAVQTPGVSDPARLFFCDGSVQPSPEANPGPQQGNVLNLLGASRDGQLILVMHGKTRAFGDGSVRIAALRYAVFDLLGNLLDGGIIAVLQQFGGLSWAQPGPIQVDGSYQSMYISADGPGGGCVMGSLTSVMSGDPASVHPTSEFIGNLEFEDDAGQFDVHLGIIGTQLPAVQLNGGTAVPAAMLGMDEHGIIAVLIGLLLPAVQVPGTNGQPGAIQGNYALFGSLADLYATVWRGSDTSFDMGRLLPAVQ